MVPFRKYQSLFRLAGLSRKLPVSKGHAVFKPDCSSLSSFSRMRRARKFILAKHFVGEPKETDFQLIEEDLPELKDGEILVEAEWLSVDPYMRPYTMGFPTGITMIGGQVARVVESRDTGVQVGSRVMGYFGWRDRTVVDMSQPNMFPMPQMPYVLPDLEGLPASLGVGVLGMPGLTAYFGVLEVLQPTRGDVVVVSGAAGAVGSLVGQIAKHAGCKVIGFAGSDEKVRWLKETLGFDEAFNYKTTNVTSALKSCAPEGVDRYFDNVGGEFSTAVLNRMNLGGKVAVCGSTSTYNASEKGRLPLAPVVQPALISKELKMEGFTVRRWNDRWLEGIHKTLQLIKQGQLIYHETVTEGFENIPRAFIGMLRGENLGKAVVKAKL